MKRSRAAAAVWFFLKRYPLLYGGLLLLMLAYSVLEGLNIAVIFPLLQAALGADQASGAAPVFVWVARGLRALPFADPFTAACALAIAVLMVKEVLGFARQALIGYGTGTVVCDVKEQVFERYRSSDYQFFLDHKQGDLTYSALLAPGRLGNCLQYLPEIVSALLMTLTIGALLVSISLPVTLALAVVALIFNACTQLLARQVSYHLGTERTAVSAEAQVVMNEFLDGIKQITVFDASRSWRARFARPVRRFKALVVKDAMWLAVPERLMQLLPAVLLLGMVVVCRSVQHLGPESLASNLALVGVYAFAFYRLAPHLTSFGKLWMQMVGTVPDVERLYDILRQPPASIQGGHRPLEGFTEAVRFEHVHFSYRGKEEVLRDISFTIERGKVTALIGSSGVGKSTVVALLTRLFDPTQGRITVDGVDLREVPLAQLRRLIGLVSQETFIFHGSVRDNIAFGLDDAPFEAIVQAARLANADQFIAQLPQGYDTVVGDKGLRLSGGQRQRLAIARAILRNPQILVLDEATSSLDYRAEALVQQAVAAACKDRTVLLITHRLSTLTHADHIVVLDQGRVAETGSPAELLERGGLYRVLREQAEDPLKSLEARPVG